MVAGLFFDMKTKFDEKKEWDDFTKRWYLEVYRYGAYNDHILANRIHNNKDGYWETPKKYVDGVAYNDGTWLEYNTIRVSNGKVRTKVMCKSKQELITTIYDYLCFLRKDGLTYEPEILYYVLVFLVDKLCYRNGLFVYNNKNKLVLCNLVKSVCKKSKSDIVCDRKDERKFAIDPRYLNKLNKSDKSQLRNKIVKKLKDDEIKKYYSSLLSIRENVEMMNSVGIKVSKTRLALWIKENCPIQSNTQVSHPEQ